VKSKLIIRRSELRDVDDLRELYLRHLTQSPPPFPHGVEKWRELLAQLIADSNYHLLVGELDGKVVSSVTLVVIPNLTHNLRPYALVENVVTHADFRKNGYARVLMNRAKEVAKSSDCYKLMLFTGAKDEKILKFYERCGYDSQGKTGFLMQLG